MRELLFDTRLWTLPDFHIQLVIALVGMIAVTALAGYCSWDRLTRHFSWAIALWFVLGTFSWELVSDVHGSKTTASQIAGHAWGMLIGIAVGPASVAWMLFKYGRPMLQTGFPVEPRK